MTDRKPRKDIGELVRKLRAQNNETLRTNYPDLHRRVNELCDGLMGVLEFRQELNQSQKEDIYSVLVSVALESIKHRLEKPNRSIS